MQLTELLKNIEVLKMNGSPEKNVRGIEFDSRKVESDSLFVAQRGVHVDGHKFITTAIEKGASVVVCESIPEKVNSEVTYIQIEDSNKILGLIASAFYGNPSKKMKVVGVTGTNGKTSIATLLFKMFMTQLKHKAQH